MKKTQMIFFLFLLLLLFAGSLHSAILPEVKAATIHSSDFETGDTSDFDADVTSGSGAVTVQDTVKANGTYAMQAYTTDGDAEVAYAYKNITATTSVYAQTMVYIDSATASQYRAIICPISFYGGGNLVVTLKISNFYTNTPGVSWNYENAGELVLGSLIENVTEDTWYRYELYVDVGNSGNITFWRNGVNLASETVDNNGDTSTIDQVRFGIFGGGFGSGENWNIKIDDTEIADSYIGTGAAGDTSAPTYSSLSSSTIVAGASCQLNHTWTDETGLATTGGFIFGHNNTGSFTNGTWAAFSSNPQTSSTTVTLNVTVGAVVQWRVWANDTSNNWNNTGLQNITLTDGTAPTFGAITSNSTVAGAAVSLSCTVSDNSAIDKVIYSWNNTGVWVNQTALSGSGTSYVANHTGTWNLTGGLIVSAKVYANDTTNNWGSSIQYNFTLTYVYLTLQVRDKDGTNISRVFSITGTLANSSSLDVDTESTGAYSLATSYGSHTFNVWWGSHLVNSSVSYSATANATVNFNTRIEYYADSSSYILWSINGTDLPTAETVVPQNCKLPIVSFSAAPELKVDVANWLLSTEPSAVNVGGYRFDKTNWAWDDTGKVLTYTLGAATDTFIVVEWGGGGSPDDGTSINNPPSQTAPDDSTVPDGQDNYVPLPERIPEPKPFVMPPEVTQAVILAVATLSVVGLLGYVYEKRRAQADASPSWEGKRKEPKRKWHD